MAKSPIRKPATKVAAPAPAPAPAQVEYASALDRMEAYVSEQIDYIRQTAQAAGDAKAEGDIAAYKAQVIAAQAWGVDWEVLSELRPKQKGEQNLHATEVKFRTMHYRIDPQTAPDWRTHMASLLKLAVTATEPGDDPDNDPVMIAQNACGSVPSRDGKKAPNVALAELDAIVEEAKKNSNQDPELYAMARRVRDSVGNPVELKRRGLELNNAQSKGTNTRAIAQFLPQIVGTLESYVPEPERNGVYLQYARKAKSLYEQYMKDFGAQEVDPDTLRDHVTQALENELSLKYGEGMEKDQPGSDPQSPEKLLAKFFTLIAKMSRNENTISRDTAEELRSVMARHNLIDPKVRRDTAKKEAGTNKPIAGPAPSVVKPTSQPVRAQPVQQVQQVTTPPAQVQVSPQTGKTILRKVVGTPVGKSPTARQLVGSAPK